MSAEPPPDADRPATGVGEWLLRGFCVGLLLLFAWLVYGYVFANGLCCADDASIAVAAKNLAFGYGYATSVPFFGGSNLSQFDPALSTGPTLVLPAAAVIRVVGNTPWAPGFAAATCSLLALVMLTLVVKRSVGATRALLLVTFFTFVLYCATAPAAFPQWYSLLGEIPAALLTALGIGVLTTDPRSRRVAFVTGLILGLALTAKTLSLLVALPVFAYLLVRVLPASGERLARLWMLVCASAGYVLPTALFELAKLVLLGWRGYVENLQAWWFFFRTGSKGDGYTLTDNLAAYRSYFDFPLVVVVGAIAVVGVLLIAGERPASNVLRFFWLTTAGAAIDLFWFVTAAPGNARFALIGTMMALLAVSCVVLSRGKPVLVVLVAVACAIPLIAPPAQMREPVRFMATEGYGPVRRVENLQRAVHWLETHKTSQRFVGGWWATVVDLEYAMSTTGNFVPFGEVPPEEYSGRILVRNTTWAAFASSPGFDEWEARCTKVLLDAEPYLITQCP